MIIYHLVMNYQYYTDIYCMSEENCGKLFSKYLSSKKSIRD